MRIQEIIHLSKEKWKVSIFFILTKKVGSSWKNCSKGTASRDLRPRYVAIHHSIVLELSTVHWPSKIMFIKVPVSKLHIKFSAFRTSTCRGWVLWNIFQTFYYLSKVDMWLISCYIYIYICPYVRTRYMYIHMGPYISLIVICLLWNLTKKNIK